MYDDRLTSSRYNCVIESPKYDSKKFNFERRLGICNFSHFTENVNPELALAAQKIQGENYLSAGYVNDQGLDEYGRLVEHLDRARGDNVEYVVAETSGQIAGAVRLIGIPEGGSLFDLPAYEKSIDSMKDDYRQVLDFVSENSNGRGVVEVSSLARADYAQPSVMLEVIREIVQQVVRSNSDELWLVTATDNSYNMIRSRFGQNAIIPIGARVPVFGDGIATEELGLRSSVAGLGLQPSLIEPSRLIEGMVDSVNAEANIAQKRRLVRMLDFMIDGLDVDMGEVPQGALDILKDGQEGL